MQGDLNLESALTPVALSLGVQDFPVFAEVQMHPNLLVRLPVLRVMVNDKSGSTGQPAAGAPGRTTATKSEVIKAAALRVLEMSDDGDHIAAISFSDTAEVLVEPTLVGLGRAAVRRAIERGAYPMGGTVMSGALAAALKMAKEFSQTHLIQILVITDGNVGEQWGLGGSRAKAEQVACRSHFRTFGDRNLPVLVVGLGRDQNDYDDAFLMELAELAGAPERFKHISDGAELAPLLADAAASAAAAAVSNVQLRFEVGDGVSVKDIYATVPDVSILSGVGGSYPLPLIEAVRGQMVLVEMRASAPDYECTIPLFTMEAVFDVPQQRQYGERDQLEVAIDVTSDSRAGRADIAVMTTAQATVSLHRAATAARLGDPDALRTASRNLQTLSTQTNVLGADTAGRLADAAAQTSQLSGVLSTQPGAPLSGGDEDLRRTAATHLTGALSGPLSTQTKPKGKGGDKS